jgi:hypothetical protein
VARWSRVCSPSSGGDAGSARGRQVVDFTQDWRFALANPNGIEVPAGYAGGTPAGFDDSARRMLDLPHDRSIERDRVPAPARPQGPASSRVASATTANRSVRQVSFQAAESASNSTGFI